MWPSKELNESIKAGLGMNSSAVSKHFEKWAWCRSSLASWCLHTEVGGADPEVLDLESGDVLYKLKGASWAIHSSGRRMAIIEGTVLKTLEIDSGLEEEMQISEITKPRVVSSADESCFIITSSNSYENKNASEVIHLYNWDNNRKVLEGSADSERPSGGGEPKFARAFYISSLGLGEVNVWVLPQADSILIKSKEHGGETLLLAMDPLDHAKKYCRKNGIVLPGWRRESMGLFNEMRNK
jgi:hypothetical protein